jgi:hypothetical protein
MGFIEEQTGRSAEGVIASLRCVDNARDGLAWSIVPAKGLRFGESLV